MAKIISISKIPEKFLSKSKEERDLLVDTFELRVDETPELVDSDPKYQLFDNEEEFRVALFARKELMSPERLFRHELSHAECAKAVGFTAIRYGLIFDNRFEGHRLVEHGVTVFGGSVILPNLAYAATFVAPSDPSVGDIEGIRRHGYHSVKYISERIELWNNSDHGLIIPMPGSIEIDV